MDHLFWAGHCIEHITCTVSFDLHKNYFMKQMGLREVPWLPSNDSRIWPWGLDTKSIIWTSCLFIQHQAILLCHRVLYFSLMALNIVFKVLFKQLFLQCFVSFSHYTAQSRSTQKAPTEFLLFTTEFEAPPMIWKHIGGAQFISSELTSITSNQHNFFSIFHWLQWKHVTFHSFQINI